MKVLVIDAAVAVRTRLVALLEEAGVMIIGEAASSQHARAFVKLHAPDAIVLDVDVAGGLLLIEELRTLAPRMQIVVLTNALSYRRRCLMLGAHAFLDKSKDFGDVARVLSEQSVA